jgi:replicative DNA helicase
MPPLLTRVVERMDIQPPGDSDVTGVATGFVDLDRMTSGLQPGELVIIAGRPSMGKAQPLTARIKTVDGWKQMGDIRLGDELASVDGRRSLVSGVFPRGRRQVFRVTFSDGRSTECCGEHLWKVYCREGEEPRVVSTDRMASMLKTRRYKHRVWIDMATGVFGHAHELPLDAWLLGALLGDGKLAGASLVFAAADAEMRERLLQRTAAQLTLRAAGGYDWRMVQAEGSQQEGVSGTPDALEEPLKALGLWGLKSEQKFIPPRYLTASRASRLDLLRGLLDADGRVEKRGSLRFCSGSERLACDVVELVRSLGGWCSVRSKRASYSYLGESEKAGQAISAIPSRQPEIAPALVS